MLMGVVSDSLTPSTGNKVAQNGLMRLKIYTHMLWSSDAPDLDPPMGDFRLVY